MQEMRGVALTAASFGLTMAVLGHAYFQKKQFYPSVVYLTKSNPSMAVLYVQAFVLIILMGKLFKKVFFGQLRAAEMEGWWPLNIRGDVFLDANGKVHLIERSWYAVTETCLAFTVFRDDFSPRFVAMFTLLLFLKCFHWLAEDRVDYMERSPVISLIFHLRVLSLLLFLAIVDVAFINFAYHSTLTKGASVQLVFGFEYAILLSIIINVFFKYILHTIDLQSENPWENKAVYMLYTDLVMGFIKVFLYTAFMAIMIKVHTFPLFAIRPMYLTMRSFKKAVNDVIMSRRAIRNMNTLYPNATPEDLSSTDNLCIICREEMVTGCKKLPCSHIFHTSCLRSWFQRQQTCPTCRMDVLRAPTATQRQNGAAVQQQQQQQQQQPQAGMMPPFAGYPFWMPQFQPPGGAHMPFHPPGMPPGFGGQPPGFGGQPPGFGGQPPGFGGQPPGFGGQQGQFPPAGANAGQPPVGGQQPAADQSASTNQTAAAGDNQTDSTQQPSSTASTSQSSSTTTPSSNFPSSLPVFPPPPGASTGYFGQTPPMPGGMPPPFMPPPPFTFMPPFGMPPPMPPPNFSGMTEDEINAMEGNERKHLEARIECLRGIHSLLDAAMIQVQQYTAVVSNLGSTVPAPPPANLYPQANTTTVSSTTTVPTPSASTAGPNETVPCERSDVNDDNADNSTSIKAKDSDADLTHLEGAVGFTTPPTEGELIPQMDEPEEQNHQEIRRRRLQKLAGEKEET